MDKPSIVSIKAQAFKDKNERECINVLLDMRRLKQIATEDGYVPITILPRTKEDNKERYGTHWAKPCLEFNIMRGTKIKVQQLAEATNIKEEAKKMNKEADSLMEEYIENINNK